jgi:hypothetical protein
MMDVVARGFSLMRRIVCGLALVVEYHTVLVCGLQQSTLRNVESCFYSDSLHLCTWLV